MTASRSHDATAGTLRSRIDVRVLSGHRHDRLVDAIDGVVRIRIVGVGDRAINRAVIDCLADALDIDPGEITIAGGRHSTAKRIEIDDLDQRDLDALMSALVPTAQVPHPDELPLEYHDAK